jgi:hypothetical protein
MAARCFHLTFVLFHLTWLIVFIDEHMLQEGIRPYSHLAFADVQQKLDYLHRSLGIIINPLVGSKKRCIYIYVCVFLEHVFPIYLE